LSVLTACFFMRLHFIVRKKGIEYILTSEKMWFVTVRHSQTVDDVCKANLISFSKLKGFWIPLTKRLRILIFKKRNRWSVAKRFKTFMGKFHNMQRKMQR
jgi:hypothetical protein